MPYDFSRLNNLDDADLQPQMPEYQVPKDNLPGVQQPASSRPTRPTDMSRGGRQKWIEQQAGWGPLGFINKPMAQFRGVLTSPDLWSGRLVADPINAISKFGNWLGDKVQGKPGDVSDAWQLPNKVGNFAPLRALPWIGSEVTESDKAARGLAGTVLPMVVSHVAGYGYLGDAVKGLGAVRSLSVAAKTSPSLARLLNIGTAVGGEVAINAAAIPFMDPQQGNLANVAEAIGVNLPGRVLPTDTYGEALGKTFKVEALAAPLGAIGALSLIKPFRRELTAGSQNFWNTTFWETMADSGVLDRYVPGSVGPQPRPTPLLPSGTAPAGAPQLPGYQQQGGALALPMPDSPWGSAIERNLAESTQIKQVQSQRQRLQDAGLLEMGPNRQLELSVGAAVDPQIKLQIRELQTQRGQLIKQANDLAASGDEAAGRNLDSSLAEIDKQIADLTLSGSTDQFLAPPARQGEFDLLADDTPDTRPELDSFLAQLDELDDSQLRDIHSRVWREAAGERTASELTAAQQQVQALQDQLGSIAERLAVGEIKPIGAKRLTAKVQKELAAAQQEVAAVQRRMQEPEPLVGDQLQLTLEPSQLGLDLTPGSSDLAPIRQLLDQRERLQAMADDATEQLRLARESKADAEQIKGLSGQQRALRGTLASLDEEIKGAKKTLTPEAQLELSATRWRSTEEAVSEFGYRTPDDYRAALEGWNRDQLRRLAMPESSPEVATLVKARTGRRVWQAKKQDIIDALVELAQRRGRFLPPDPPVAEQGALRLTSNPLGGDAPLFDQPADLSAPGMTKVLDADGVEQLVPASPYTARGMDPAARERMRMEILNKAIQNGEVQAPITPIPQRPAAPEYVDQASFLDDLFADPTGQLPLQFATDQLPVYEAGGKNAAALIDEMRLRFQYVRLDNEAAQAQKEAFMAAHGWDNLSWDDKKKLGLLGKGMFAFDKYDLIKNNTDVVRPATPQFNPELPVKDGPLPPNRPPAAQPDGVMLVNRDGAPAAEPIGKAKGKASEVEAAAQAAATKKAAKAADGADKQAINNASAARQELLKRRERLAKQAKGASC